VSVRAKDLAAALGCAAGVVLLVGGFAWLLTRFARCL